MTRRKAREILMQLIFQMEAQKDHSDEAMEILLREMPSTGPTQKEYIRAGYHAVRDHLEEIDQKIEAHAKGRTLRRQPKVELAILRLALAELFYLPEEEIPQAVALHEAVELAKAFGCEEGADAFVNGTLREILRQEEAHA